MPPGIIGTRLQRIISCSFCVSVMYDVKDWDSASAALLEQNHTFEY